MTTHTRNAQVEKSEQRPSPLPPPERFGIWRMRLLILLGLASLWFYYDWWRVPGRIASPGMAFLLFLGSLYYCVQVLGTWGLYLAARRRSEPPMPPAGLTVDVFVTACREPVELVEKCLSAACRMRGGQETYLLDDGEDPALRALAERLGAHYLTRDDRKHAKAGNLNAGLLRSQGDVVVIFDIDHVPTPDFLERTLGYFRDPKIGFVQVMLTFDNGRESWVARAAAESSIDFYNPASIGMDGIGCATLIGSNALIRRTALESVGGYHPGLAEDLATSMAIHAEGWRSVYVAEPLAPGLAPLDLAAWFTQQMKWARGVFELLILDYPRFFFRFTWGQRLSYAVRSTYYLIGVTVAIHLFFTIAVLLGGAQVARVDFRSYVQHITPLFFCSVLIRQAAIATWRHASTGTGALWRPMVLVYATWPVYVVAWLMAVIRLPLAFRPTPKSSSGAVRPLWLLPQAMTLVLLTAAVIECVLKGETAGSLLFVCTAALQGVPQMLLLLHAARHAARSAAA